MSYDLALFTPSGQNPHQTFNKLAKAAPAEESIPELEARKHLVAQALQQADPSLEARTRSGHLELNAPNNGSGFWCDLALPSDHRTPD